MSIVEVNGCSEMPTIIIGRDTNIRDALEARRVSTGPMALTGKRPNIISDKRDVDISCRSQFFSKK